LAFVPLKKCGTFKCTLGAELFMLYDLASFPRVKTMLYHLRIIENLISGLLSGWIETISLKKVINREGSAHGGTNALI